MADRILLDRGLAPALAARGLAAVDTVLALGGDLAARSVVTELQLPIEGTVGRVHLKRYVYASWPASRGLLGRGTLWGRAPEMREFRALAWLREHGIPAVRPLVAVSRTRRRRLVAHALLTEHVPHAIDLSQRLRTPGDPVRESAATRRRVLVLIGRHLARMHAEGFVHGDAYARNILVRLDGDVAIWFLDCRRGGTATWRRPVLDDLATLDGDLAGRVPASDRLRGLKAYLPDGASPRAGVRRVTRKRDRILGREARKGRVRR